MTFEEQKKQIISCLSWKYPQYKSEIIIDPEDCDIFRVRIENVLNEDAIGLRKYCWDVIHSIENENDEYFFVPSIRRKEN